MPRRRGRSHLPAPGTISASSFGWPTPEASLGERVMAVEVAQEMTTARMDERMGALVMRSNETDRRLNDGRKRMDEIDDRLRDTTREVGALMFMPEAVRKLQSDLAPLSRLPSHMKRIEGKIDRLGSTFVKYRNGALYFVGMLMLSLVLSGKMTIDQFWKIVLALGKQLL